jgi:hypothetical protein
MVEETGEPTLVKATLAVIRIGAWWMLPCFDFLGRVLVE